MGRYLAGIASALLLVIGGILFWSSRAANKDHSTAPPVQVAAAESDAPLDDAIEPSCITKSCALKLARLADFLSNDYNACL